MDRFAPCLVPPPLPTPTREEGGGVSPSWAILDQTAYLSADAVASSTTAIGRMSNGGSIHVSLCLGRPPVLSYLCAHFPGPVVGPTVGTAFGPAAGTPAVRCVGVPPFVVTTHAGLALIRVTIPGGPCTNEDISFDYFVYTARPRPGASSLDLLPRPTATPRFRDSDVAIVRGGGGSRYVIAALRTTSNPRDFTLQRYDSATRSWTMTPLSLHEPERVRAVLPATETDELLYYNTTKVVVLGSTTVGWVDLWVGILFCDVLDEKPVLRVMPLPKPARSNRSSFRIGSPYGIRDMAVLTLPVPEEEQQQQQVVKVIKYVEMEFHRPRGGSSSDTDSDEDEVAVAYYWTATVWSMPVPITSRSDWHKDCKISVADTVVDDPRHCEVLLALPTRLSTDPEDAAVSFTRLNTGCPTLGLGMDGNLAIYFLSNVGCCALEEGLWMIAVGVKDNKLQGIAKLDDRRNMTFRGYYCTTDISKYLIKATGAAGALVPTRISNKSSRK